MASCSDLVLFQGRQSLLKMAPCLGANGSLKVRSWRIGRFPVSAKGEDGGEENAIRDTIEKSRKILSMQQKLLHKVAERRKIVSSIKDTALNAEKDADSYSEGSFSSSDSSLSSKESNGKYNSSITSDKYRTADAPTATIRVGFVGEMQDVKSFDQNKDTESGLKTVSSVPEGVESAKNVSSEEGAVDLESPNYVISDEAADGLKASKDLVLERDPTTVPSTLPKLSLAYDVKEQTAEDVPEVRERSYNVEKDVAPEEPIEPPPPLAGANVMNVILVAAECAPWCKTGGLGDVAGALPKALARRGHRVMVVVPRYGNYAEPQDVGVRKRYKVDGQDMEVTYFHAYIDGVDFVFVDSPIFSHRENNIYGGERVDVLKRMILLCKAAVEVPWHVPCGGVCYGDGNLVFIANDWHTALLPVYLKAYYRDNGLMKYTRSVLVIHNIAHQGRGPLEDFDKLDLPEHYIDLFKLYDPVGGEHANVFAAGLKAADRVVTVSHGYAWELKTVEGGWGLDGIINENDWKFQGIINGIDTKDWNPAVDVHLKNDGYTNYCLENLKKGKAQCKEALQKELGLPVRPEVPVIGFIGRLDYQKGVDLIEEAMPWIVNQDVQMVMLGTGRPDLEEMLRKFEREHHDKVRGWVGFSVKTAHRITAGADILLMPSRFEPCGLNQLYAMMYGTVPVVHAVGGLRDTVIQFDPFAETGFGWAFDRAEANRLIDAFGNCLNTYWNYKESWEGLQKRGMMQDLSWDSAAQRYEEVLVAAKYHW